MTDRLTKRQLRVLRMVKRLTFVWKIHTRRMWRHVSEAA